MESGSLEPRHAARPRPRRTISAKLLVCFVFLRNHSPRRSNWRRRELSFEVVDARRATEFIYCSRCACVNVNGISTTGIASAAERFKDSRLLQDPSSENRVPIHQRFRQQWRQEFDLDDSPRRRTIYNHRVRLYIPRSHFVKGWTSPA